jgi:DNA-binding transcriptional regulator YbjK
MPRYVIKRSFSVREDQMPEVGRRSRQIIEQQLPEITWHHSHITVDEEGNVRSFCIYDAPNEDAIYEHSKLLGDHVLDEIFEIAGDVTPEDFPLTEAPA